MTTQKRIQQINHNFTVYETLQKDHIRIMQTRELPDLEAMTAERNAAFLTLKKSLDDFMETLTVTAEDDHITAQLTSFENRIQSVAGLDEILTNEVHKYKDRLKTHLNQLKQGRKALSGYRPDNPDAKKPHVFSMIR